MTDPITEIDDAIRACMEARGQIPNTITLPIPLTARQRKNIYRMTPKKRRYVLAKAFKRAMKGKP